MEIKTIKWLYQRIKTQNFRMFLLVLGNALFSASAVIFALICKDIVDSATSHQKDKLISSIAGFAVLIAIQLILRLFCNSMKEYIKSKTAMQLRQYIMQIIMNREYSHIEHYHSGELLNRMFSDVQIIAEHLTGILPNLVNVITRLIFAAAVLIYLDKYFSAMFIIAAIFMYIVIRLMRGRLKGLHKEVQKREDKVRSYLQEAVENLRVVKVFEIEDKMLDKAWCCQKEHFSMQMKQRTFNIIANAGFNFIFQAGYFCALAWGAFGIYNGKMTYGTLTALLQLVGQIQAPLTNLSGMLPQWYNMIASAERVIELEKIKENQGSERLDGSSVYRQLKEIRFENVEFSYGRNTVLKDVNISLKKGNFIAVTGLSGGGKSTLFSLLMGLYSPLKGKIQCICENEVQGELNNNAAATVQNSNAISVSDVSALFAYVPQGNCLFSGTLRENITMLNDSATQEEIDKALEMVCADGFISELPDGLDTYIGEDGAGLSEGQAQRIAVARALLKDSPVLLLDEATSALDEDTEFRLLENISKLDNKMCLIVTHRRAALNICTSQLIIKDGTVSQCSINVH